MDYAFNFNSIPASTGSWVEPCSGRPLNAGRRRHIYLPVTQASFALVQSGTPPSLRLCSNRNIRSGARLKMRKRTGMSNWVLLRTYKGVCRIRNAKPAWVQQRARPGEQIVYSRNTEMTRRLSAIFNLLDASPSNVLVLLEEVGTARTKKQADVSVRRTHAASHVLFPPAPQLPRAPLEIMK